MPPELIRELIGAKGIGTHYLCDEVGPEVEPLSPEAKLIFVIGPMAGTSMLGQQPLRALLRSRRSPTRYCECYSGGNLAPQFARTGYKVVIVEGKADGHVYLEISEEGVAFHSADDLWGLDAFVSPKTRSSSARRTRRRRPASSARPVRTSCASPASTTTTGTSSAAAAPAPCSAARTSRASSGTARRRSRSRVRTTYKAVVSDLVERTKDDPGVAAYQRGGTLEHGAHPERRERLSHALLAQGHARGLRAHHRRDDAGGARHQERGLPAVRHEVRQAQLRLRGPAQGSRVRGARVRDGLRVRRPLRDRRLRRAHVAQRHLRPPRRRHHERRQPVRAGHRGVAARSDRREDGLRRPRLRRRRSSARCACARASATSGPTASCGSRRSTGSKASPCTPRAWSRRATIRAP